MQGFKGENLLAAVSQGLDGETPYFNGEHRGGQCHVFKLSFKSRKSSLAVRVPLYMPVCSPDEKIDALRMEMQSLQTLETKGFQWAPKCYGHSLTFDNPVRHPFIILTWIEGSVLHWDEESPPPLVRDKLLRQLASIQLSLIKHTLEEGTTNATDHFERMIRNRRARVQEGRLSGLCEQDCIDQLALLDQILGKDGDSTAFAMEHGDIKPDNIIVDDEYNIQRCFAHFISIIDWAFAAHVPIARAACLPRFLWPDSFVYAPSPTVQRDRKSYIAFSASDSPPLQIAPAYIQHWQAAVDVDFRTLYLESILSRGVHEGLARAGWRLAYCPSGVVEDESEELSNRHPMESSMEL
ncbi:MAG: hypothetical protein M1820_008347 [Bogoriella megaspora]|nr:MAG: hypothetical protein M1820_008347 [Bogoriella megaspora]